MDDMATIVISSVVVALVTKSCMKNPRRSEFRWSLLKYESSILNFKFYFLDAIMLTAGQGPCQISVIDLTISSQEPSEIIPMPLPKNKQDKNAERY